jgi:alpha-galactosidase
VVVEYHDYPAVDWTLYFKNDGGAPSPVLKDVQALDSRFERKAGGEFVLHGTIGDWCTATSFEPFNQTLEPGTTKRFAPFGGRPTNAAWSGSWPFPTRLRST